MKIRAFIIVLVFKSVLLREDSKSSFLLGSYLLLSEAKENAPTSVLILLL